MIFNIPEEIQCKLNVKQKRSKPVEYIFKNIFSKAKEIAGVTELSIQEITAGYYMLVTAPTNGKLINKRRITNLVGMHSGIDGSRRLLTRTGYGTYKLYEEGDDEKYSKFLPKKYKKRKRNLDESK